jgi:anaerobic magnesium-protoporphyrin IX monomethyl ester cyclase
MTPYSPLSTLISAALLRASDHHVQVFDATFSHHMDQFENVVNQLRPSVVAIMEDNFNFLTKMCTIRRREDALSMIAVARRYGCRVLVNGPDSSDFPGLYLDSGADAVLLGEGEAALAEICDHWRHNTNAPLENIAGLVLRHQGMEHRTARRAHQRALDQLPLPAWDLVDAGAYRDAWTPRHGYFSWNMATSRGCPYGCNWCAKPIFGRGYEQRSAASIAEELSALKAAIAPDHVWFADDIFGLTTEWIATFASEVTRLNAATPFTMQSRVNLMSPDAVAALATAQAKEVWLGVESGSQKILDAMEKGSRVEEAIHATRNLKAQGIRAGWFIQLGYPGETWEDLSRTRELLISEMPDDIGVSVAYPLPGTRFHALVKAQLGERHNWQDSNDLAMLFEGTYDTAFYRILRDFLHQEVRAKRRDDIGWARLKQDEPAHRSANPVLLATGS